MHHNAVNHEEDISTKWDILKEDITLVNMSPSMMSKKKLTKYFWAKATLIANMIQNVSPYKVVINKLHMMHGEKKAKSKSFESVWLHFIVRYR